MIKSIGYSQEEIIKDIILLHNGGRDIECDPTYSKGVFYKNINRPRYTFDLHPQDELTVQADCRELPLENDSVESIMFDPPFIIGGGPSLLVDKEGSNIISSRFSNFTRPGDLYNMYYLSLFEFFRVLKKEGTLIFKCQDQVSSGKQFFIHCMVYQWAETAGFYPKDLFILLSKGRITSGKWKNQYHARKHHSYFWVFKK